MRLTLLAALALPILAVGAPLEDPARVWLPPPDTLTEAHGWAAEAVASLNLSQAAYANWQEGGVSTLAVTANVRGRFARVRGAFRQRHDSRLGYGLVRQDTLSPRKALDVVRYSLDLQYTALGAWQPTFATELRTQFTPGFDYEPNVERYPDLAHLIAPGQRLKVSDAFSPATWTQALGMAYEPEGWFRARAGLGLKQTIVLIDRLRPVHGVPIDRPVRLQAGLEALLEARGELFENVHLQSRLSLFQAFTQFAEGAPDLLWENTVQLRVNRWLTVNGEVVAVYDRDVLDRIQLKEVLSLGLSITLL